MVKPNLHYANARTPRSPGVFIQTSDWIKRGSKITEPSLSFGWVVCPTTLVVEGDELWWTQNIDMAELFEGKKK